MLDHRHLSALERNVIDWALSTASQAIKLGKTRDCQRIKPNAASEGAISERDARTGSVPRRLSALSCRYRRGRFATNNISET